MRKIFARLQSLAVASILLLTCNAQEDSPAIETPPTIGGEQNTSPADEAQLPAAEESIDLSKQTSAGQDQVEADLNISIYKTARQCATECLDKDFTFCPADDFSFGYCCQEQEQCDLIQETLATVCSNSAANKLQEYFVCPFDPKCGPQQVINVDSYLAQLFIDTDSFGQELELGDRCGYMLQGVGYKMNDFIIIQGIDFNKMKLTMFSGGFSMATSKKMSIMRPDESYRIIAAQRVFIMAEVLEHEVGVEKPFFSFTYQKQNLAGVDGNALLIEEDTRRGRQDNEGREAAYKRLQMIDKILKVVMIACFLLSILMCLVLAVMCCFRFLLSRQLKVQHDIHLSYAQNVAASNDSDEDGDEETERKNGGLELIEKVSRGIEKRFQESERDVFQDHGFQRDINKYNGVIDRIEDALGNYTVNVTANHGTRDMNQTYETRGEEQDTARGFNDLNAISDQDQYYLKPGSLGTNDHYAFSNQILVEDHFDHQAPVFQNEGFRAPYENQNGSMNQSVTRVISPHPQDIILSTIGDAQDSYMRATSQQLNNMSPYQRNSSLLRDQSLNQHVSRDQSINQHVSIPNTHEQSINQRASSQGLINDQDEQIGDHISDQSSEHQRHLLNIQLSEEHSQDQVQVGAELDDDEDRGERSDTPHSQPRLAKKKKKRRKQKSPEQREVIDEQQEQLDEIAQDFEKDLNAIEEELAREADKLPEQFIIEGEDDDRV